MLRLQDLLPNTTYKVPGNAEVRCDRGHNGSVSFLGIHMGNPENEVMLGDSSSAVMNGAPMYPTEKTPFGSLMRTVGPFSIFILPSVKLTDSMKPNAKPSKNSYS